MDKWPASWWGQGWISFAVASVSAYFVFVRMDNVLFERAAKEAPYDGQDGLSAFMGAIQLSIFTLIGVFVVLLVIQRLFTSIRSNRSQSHR